MLRRVLLSPLAPLWCFGIMAGLGGVATGLATASLWPIVAGVVAQGAVHLYWHFLLGLSLREEREMVRKDREIKELRDELHYQVSAPSEWEKGICPDCGDETQLHTGYGQCTGCLYGVEASDIIP
jgi:hypothetical protein